MNRSLPLPRLRPAWALGIATVSALLFAAMVADLMLHGPVTRADVPVSRWFSLHAQAGVTELMRLASALHSTLPLCLFTAALGAALWVLHQRRWIPLLVLSVPGGLLLNTLVKLVFQRARPAFDNPLVTLSTFSFPSGHAAGATVWWGFLLVLYLAHETRAVRRVPAVLGAAAMVVVTALSRVYLGAHFPSDVVAGIAEGTLWLVLCCSAAGAVAHRREQVPGAGLA
jgi:undecaprenyl-diphosphatase